ncbi:MAG: methyl-accepting chemotaxis protein [Butyricicoccus sp.]|nr:methyl-accepting chemotaxis protein [Butyricicoccus sp.]
MERDEKHSKENNGLHCGDRPDQPARRRRFQQFKVTGELSIMFAAPLYEGGSQDGKIVGVVYFVPPETFLNDIVSSIKLGENCRAYMINRSGDTIADITLDTVTTQNIESEAKSDPSLQSRVELHKAMRGGENGFSSMEQASSIQELAATINDISTNAKKTSAAAEEAGRSVEQVGSQLGTSVKYVRELNAAMEQMSSSSEKISKIISAIESIAFQTNILALNAAVEAARAGAAGKGFAVVADEVRNLATKSDEAAKATKDLIEGSINSAAEGSRAVERVTEALERTNKIAGGVSAQMNVVVESVERQTADLEQVTEGIDQISSVVQTNSATAEESAAASEELSAEASGLKQMVDQFTLASEMKQESKAMR